MSNFSIISPLILKKEKKFQRDLVINMEIKNLKLNFIYAGETEPFPWAMIMDDPDAMAAVGKVWVHWIKYGNTDDSETEGKNDFGEIGYGGPAPPDGRHTYIFKGI